MNELCFPNFFAAFFGSPFFLRSIKLACVPLANVFMDASPNNSLFTSCGSIVFPISAFLSHSLSLAVVNPLAQVACFFNDLRPMGLSMKCQDFARAQVKLFAHRGLFIVERCSRNETRPPRAQWIFATLILSFVCFIPCKACAGQVFQD